MNNTILIALYWTISILAFIALPFFAHFTANPGAIAVLAIFACYCGIKADLLEIKDKLK